MAFCHLAALSPSHYRAVGVSKGRDPGWHTADIASCGIMHFWGAAWGRLVAKPRGNGVFFD